MTTKQAIAWNQGDIALLRYGVKHVNGLFSMGTKVCVEAFSPATGRYCVRPVNRPIELWVDDDNLVSPLLWSSETP